MMISVLSNTITNSISNTITTITIIFGKITKYFEPIFLCIRIMVYTNNFHATGVESTVSIGLI